MNVILLKKKDILSSIFKERRTIKLQCFEIDFNEANLKKRKEKRREKSLSLIKIIYSLI